MARTLSELPLKLSYRTGRDDLVRDLFVPCLEHSVLYRRAAGYFTSAGRGFGDSVQEAQMRRSDPLKEVTDGEADKPQMLQQAGGNGTISTDDSAATRSPTRRT